MRVLHVDSGRQMRGGQWQALRLAEGMLEAGHAPILLADSYGPLLAEAARRRIPARRLSLPALWRLSRDAGLVHAHDARSHTLAAIAGCSPLVVSRRVAFPLAGGIFTRWKYGRAAHYIAVSGHVEGILRVHGIPSEKITVVYDGVPEPCEPAMGDLIVAPSTEDPEKGSDLLREAARRAGVTVLFSGDLAEDLRRAGIFVYITRQEGLGSAVLLAMAAGVPVIASRVGGLQEVVEHGVTGLLAGNEPEAIADAIRLLADNRALGAALAARAIESVREKFSVQRMVRDTLKVYERVLKV